MLLPETILNLNQSPTSLAIDPAKTLVTGFTYGGYDDKGRLLRAPLLIPTRLWIERTFPKENIFNVCGSPLICARNRTIRDFVLPKADAYEWYLSIDNDITITHPGVYRFLSLKADVISCNCRIAGGQGWDDPRAFHTGFWCCRIAVLKAIKPPWFLYPYSDDGCELLGCSCSYFRDKVLAAGFSVKHGGHCGHQMRDSTWWPKSAQESPQFRMGPGLK